MGDTINLQRFEVLYDELVKKDEVEISQELAEHDMDMDTFQIHTHHPAGSRRPSRVDASSNLLKNPASSSQQMLLSPSSKPASPKTEKGLMVGCGESLSLAANPQGGVVTRAVGITRTLSTAVKEYMQASYVHTPVRTHSRTSSSSSTSNSILKPEAQEAKRCLDALLDTSAFEKAHNPQAANKNMSWTDSEHSFDDDAKVQAGLGPQAQEANKDLVPRYLARLMQCQHSSPGELPLAPITGSRAEFVKRQPMLLREVSAILSGSENFKRFCEIIDSADIKCRVDMFDVLARQLKMVGMLMRVAYCAEHMSQAPMDPSVCCKRFVHEVKLLIRQNVAAQVCRVSKYTYDTI